MPHKYRKTGYSLGQHFGYLIDYSNNGGYWTKEALAETDLTYEFGQPRPGDFVYKDLNDDNVINEADYAPIGNGTVPRFTYGFSLGFDFKGIDFSVFFQGLGGYTGSIWATWSRVGRARAPTTTTTAMRGPRSAGSTATRSPIRR